MRLIHDEKQMDFFQPSYFGKTSPACSAQKITPSVASWLDSPGKMLHSSRQGVNGRTLVVFMDPREQSRGGSQMPNISEWPNDAAVCSLSQVLEKTSIRSRYFLSKTACAGILRRAEKRGKTLPAQLARALQAVAGLELTSSSGGGFNQSGIDLRNGAITGEVAHTLQAGAHAPDPGGTPHVFSVALRGREGGATAELGGDVAGTLRASGGGGDKAHVLAPIAFDSRQDCVSSTEVFGALGSSSPQAQAVAHAIQAGALRTNPNSGPDGVGVQADVAYTLEARSEVQCAQMGMAVRRLTPRECERLQGFPDDYTFIPTWNGWRKMDSSETPESCLAEGLEIKQNKKTGKWRVKDVDGPRYKALGNSWAVPNVAWIGRRIAQQLEAA